jgi:hypothetical protein
VSGLGVTGPLSQSVSGLLLLKPRKLGKLSLSLCFMGKASGDGQKRANRDVGRGEDSRDSWDCGFDGQLTDSVTMVRPGRVQARTTSNHCLQERYVD